LVQAAALTLGVALYTINWQRVRWPQRTRALPTPA
jgi:hypothetical protein